MASKKTNKQTSTSAIAQDINNNNIMNTTKNNQHVSTTTDAPPNGPMRRSKRAGVVFPVHRIHRVLKERNTSRQIRDTAAVYMAGVLEYLVAEVTELAGNVARDHKRHRITPRHIFLAIHNDDELSKTCDNVTIAAGGVMPHIHAVLLPSKVSNSQSLKGDAPKAPKKKPNSKKQDATKVTANTDNGDDSTMEQ